MKKIIEIIFENFWAFFIPMLGVAVLDLINVYKDSSMRGGFVLCILFSFRS